VAESCGGVVWLAGYHGSNQETWEGHVDRFPGHRDTPRPKLALRLPAALDDGDNQEDPAR